MDVEANPSQDVSIFAGSVKRRKIWRCPDGRRLHSDWPILDDFNRLLFLIGSIINNNYQSGTCDFVEGARNTQWTANLTRYAVSPSDADHFWSV